MDGLTNLRALLDDAQYQLEQVVSGMTESQLDHRLVPTSMTPRETLVHVTECYVAGCATAEGKEHEWGSYQAASSDLPSLLEAYRTERAKAVEELVVADEGRIRVANWLIGHDYYHVGQLAATRLATDPEWDTFSIYRG
jgi:hypothetical protein